MRRGDRRPAPRPAVAGEHDAEGELEETFQRADLFRPRMPVHALARAEPTIGCAPEMVAGEQHVAVQQRDAALRVAGDRHDQQVVGERDGGAALEQALDRRCPAGHVRLVQDPLAAEARAELERAYGLQLGEE